ncbi:MAG: flagellar biosynthesis anti-sigma factor FlgM [Pseudomonadales bacterium]
MNIDKPDTQVTRGIVGERAADLPAKTARPHSAPDSAPAAEEPQFSDGVQALLDTERAAGPSSIDEARVERIRQAIAEGTYHVDPERLAQRFIDLEILIDQ